MQALSEKEIKDRSYLYKDDLALSGTPNSDRTYQSTIKDEDILLAVNPLVEAKKQKYIESIPTELWEDERLFNKFFPESCFWFMDKPPAEILKNFASRPKTSDYKEDLRNWISCVVMFDKKLQAESLSSLAAKLDINFEDQCFIACRVNNNALILEKLKQIDDWHQVYQAITAANKAMTEATIGNCKFLIDEIMKTDNYKLNIHQLLLEACKKNNIGMVQTILSSMQQEEKTACISDINYLIFRTAIQAGNEELIKLLTGALTTLDEDLKQDHCQPAYLLFQAALIQEQTEVIKHLPELLNALQTAPSTQGGHNKYHDLLRFAAETDAENAKKKRDVHHHENKTAKVYLLDCLTTPHRHETTGFSDSVVRQLSINNWEIIRFTADKATDLTAEQADRDEVLCNFLTNIHDEKTKLDIKKQYKLEQDKNYYTKCAETNNINGMMAIESKLTPTEYKELLEFNSYEVMNKMRKIPEVFFENVIQHMLSQKPFYDLVKQLASDPTQKKWAKLGAQADVYDLNGTQVETRNKAKQAADKNDIDEYNTKVENLNKAIDKLRKHGDKIKTDSEKIRDEVKKQFNINEGNKAIKLANKLETIVNAYTKALENGDDSAKGIAVINFQQKWRSNEYGYATFNRRGEWYEEAVWILKEIAFAATLIGLIATLVKLYKTGGKESFFSTTTRHDYARDVEEQFNALGERFPSAPKDNAGRTDSVVPENNRDGTNSLEMDDLAGSHSPSGSILDI